MPSGFFAQYDDDEIMHTTIVPACEPDCNYLVPYFTIQRVRGTDEYSQFDLEHDFTYWYKEKGNTEWILGDSKLLTSTGLSSYYNQEINLFLPPYENGTEVVLFLQQGGCSPIDSFDPNTATEREKEALKRESRLKYVKLDYDTSNKVIYSSFTDSWIGSNCDPDKEREIYLELTIPYFDSDNSIFPVCLFNESTTMKILVKEPGEADFKTVETIAHSTGTSGHYYLGTWVNDRSRKFDLTKVLKDFPVGTIVVSEFSDKCGRTYRTKENKITSEPPVDIKENLLGRIWSGTTSTLKGTGYIAVSASKREDLEMTVTRVDGQTDIPITDLQKELAGRSFTAHFPVKAKLKSDSEYSLRVKDFYDKTKRF